MKKQCKKMSTAFTNKGIASTKKKCKDENEKNIAALKKEHQNQVELMLTNYQF